MNFDTQSSVFHSGNRNKLANLLPSGSMAIIFSNDEMHRNGGQNFPFRQSSDMLYLTGIHQEKTILCIYPEHPIESKREVLFMREGNATIEMWEGHKLSPDEAKDISGVQIIPKLEDFEIYLREAMQVVKTVYLNSNEYPKYYNDQVDRQTRMNKEIMEKYPLHRFERLAPLLAKLRGIKQEFDIRMMRKATEITGKAFHRILQTTKPGMTEFQVEAELRYIFHQNGARSVAYPPIVASGKNALCLHYTENSSVLNEGDLLLLDFGCEWNGYASDLSRTIPISGTFTPRQKELYEAVLEVYQQARDLYKPGYTINEVNRIVSEWMENAMMKVGLFNPEDLAKQDIAKPLKGIYFPHGVAHFIGLDVHDVGTKDDVFQEGMVLTCEPGIYIPEEGVGIRIETDLLITADGPIDLFEGLPLTVDEIEQAMRQRN